MKKWQAFVGVVLVAATSSWPKSSTVVTTIRRNPLVRIVEKLVVRPLQHRGRRLLHGSRPDRAALIDARRMLSRMSEERRWMSDS